MGSSSSAIQSLLAMGASPIRFRRYATHRRGTPPPAAAASRYNDAMKFGRVKRQHGRIGGLDSILDRIVRDCPHVSRIVPGRIKVRRGKTPANFKIQYPTTAGLKCQYIATGTVQEVFLICTDVEATKLWLLVQEIATP
jgi:hypothetical protein